MPESFGQAHHRAMILHHATTTDHGLCGSKGHMTDDADRVTCSYCRHSMVHGASAVPQSGIGRALYEMGNGNGQR